MRDFFQSVTDDTLDFSITNEAVTAMRAKKEKPKFSDEEKAALKKLNDEHKKKLNNSYIIRDFCDNLISKNYIRHEKALFRAITIFRDKNVQRFSSPYIMENIFFCQSDIDIVFQVCETTQKEVSDMLDQLEDLPINTDQYFQERLQGKQIQKKNLIPFRVLLIMILRYYIMKNDKDKADQIMFYYAASQFPSIYSAQFRNGIYRKEAMIYAVDHMTQKFILKKEGSVEGAIVYPIRKSAMETYYHGLIDGSDFWIPYIIDQFKSRTNEMMKSVREAYETAYIEGNMAYTDNGSISEDGEQIERETSMSKIISLATQYTTDFYSKSIKLNLVKSACSCAGNVSPTEIRAALETMQQDQHSNELQEFYECLFNAYNQNMPNFTKADLKSAKFLQVADAIYKKGNSNDYNVQRIKKITHTWLVRGSASYRASNNAGTLNYFRKAIYMYFVFNVVT